MKLLLPFCSYVVYFLVFEHFKVVIGKVWQHDNIRTQVCMYLQDKNLAYPPLSRFSHPIVNHRTIIDQQFTTLDLKVIPLKFESLFCYICFDFLWRNEKIKLVILENLSLSNLMFSSTHNDITQKKSCKVSLYKG